jgi:hypothetical protein
MCICRFKNPFAPIRLLRIFHPICSSPTFATKYAISDHCSPRIISRKSRRRPIISLTKLGHAVMLAFKPIPSHLGDVGSNHDDRDH